MCLFSTLMSFALFNSDRGWRNYPWWQLGWGQSPTATQNQAGKLFLQVGGFEHCVEQCPVMCHPPCHRLQTVDSSVCL